MSNAPDLPSGWALAPLETVAAIRDELRQPVNADERSKRVGPYPYYGATGQVGWIDDFRLDGSYVLLGEDGAPFLDPVKPKAYLIQGKAWVNNHAHVLQAIEGISDNRFIMYALNSFNYAGVVNGTTRLKLTQAAMRQMLLPLPPLAEQRRIVAVIEEQFTRLDAGVAALKSARARLKQYRAAVLKAAVEGELTKAWREAHPNTEPASELLVRILAERRAWWEAEQRAKGKNLAKSPYREPDTVNADGLGKISEGWCWATVEQLGTIGEQAVLTGPFGSSLGRSDFITDGVPVLTIGCLTRQGLDLKKALYVSEMKASELQRYRVRPGDLLFSRMASVGRAEVVSGEFSGALVNYHLMRLRLSDQVIDPIYFINYVRGSAIVENYVRQVNHGATRDGINTEQLLGLPVALPSLPEQEQIVAEVERRLSVLNALEVNIQAGLIRAERLRQSILTRAFAGQLVPQDQNDEAATDLLARISQNKKEGLLHLSLVGEDTTGRSSALSSVRRRRRG